MQDQSSLGGHVVNRTPSFNGITRMGKVTSTKDYTKYGRIEVIFLDYSVPMQVWVVGDIDREPMAGDSVLVGYMDGRKDCPYLVGFVKNESYTTNFVVLKKDKIKLQLPIFGIEEKDSPATKDVQGHLLDNSRQAQRAYIELDPEQALVSFPTSEDGSTPPATLKLTKDGVEVFHPKDVTINPKGKVIHHGGGKGVARMGDTVEVEVTVAGTDSNGDSINITAKGTGTITSSSTKTLID